MPNNCKIQKIKEWKKYKNEHHIIIDSGSERLVIETALNHDHLTIPEVYEAYESSRFRQFLQEVADNE